MLSLKGEMWKLLIFLGCVALASAVPADYKLYNSERAEELAGEFQGDMIISQEDIDQWNGLISDTYRWKNHIVPYTINPTYFSE